MTLLRDDFAVVSPRGLTVRTFSDRALAIAYVKTSPVPDLSIEHVQQWETRQKVRFYRPRPKVDELAVPPMPVMA